MNATDYPVVLIYSDDEQAWLARVEQLPGLVVDGATPEEALAKSKDAIVVWLETTKALGRDVPVPLSEERFHEAQFALMNQQNQLLQQAFQQAVDLATQSQKGDFAGRFAVDTTRPAATPVIRSKGYVEA